ncbi:hypothetical protein [Pseudobacillus wudalianchiensis]|uniref:Uncharacterized protein n=1 Tax=Pseudobacillus wudalianchiensis TaxID=1743143 RepID=A0A1B9AAR5_9BACI|nr:hypothetical protein [Bacillus wudalianchiensis]OCA80929.1 hypothetical protein A8F95_17655 [Bacillus wudalianchiensis]
MRLKKWTYSRRYNIKAIFDKFPHSNVIFRTINQFYFVYIVNWSEKDPVVTRADLEQMEQLLNEEMGTAFFYHQRKSQIRKTERMEEKPSEKSNDYR